MALVTIPEVLRHLNMPEDDTSNNVELQTFVDAAKPIIEHIIGAVEPQSFTEVHPACGDTIMLRNVPVLSITSVKEYVAGREQELTEAAFGPSMPTGQYHWNLESNESGKLVRWASGHPTSWQGLVQVTFMSGLVSVPADVKLAVLEDIRALWQQTQTASRPQFGGGGAIQGPDSWESDLFLFPRLSHILEGRKRTQAIA